MSSFTLSSPDLHPMVTTARSTEGSSMNTGTLCDTNEPMEEVFRIRPADRDNINLADFESLAEMLWSPQLIIELDAAKLSHLDILRLTRSWTTLALRTGLSARQVNLTSLGASLSNLHQVEALRRVFDETAAADSRRADPPQVICHTIFIAFPGIDQVTNEVASHCLRMANVVVLPAKDGSLVTISKPTLRNLQDIPLSIRNTVIGTMKGADPTVVPQAEASTAGGFIQCDSCGKMRLVDRIALAVSQKLRRFDCGMLENTRCMQADEWRPQYSPFAGADGVPPGAAQRVDYTIKETKPKTNSLCQGMDQTF
ncbi:hypothetical protein Pmar_PMAR010466 [Perkinsus marinus ATCC 50983]|uniref:Uncharacterized protein n=1 Tax=Perkinsus marinus (strain ATCC 50983 / TXsc) TaxID=423536 RepID=C5LED2_PERM5|nr:hypothetical protein Pmar_PMAR010466 [Perkinsus marinus ATCC 50983]EER04914.1 hypothetical protein Pmar_PMAR010466 [Perkinsus marinus ATCC 50983]|eukprot:XP_002773098.1 hypothetical protein Pmar_PMAR010466 [Perkinsus marinus ATCC 50983]